ncbi:MAG: dihydropteroate synthase DHPS [Dehalococcoidia bacterium]|nr:MAG: dihydropteroate synthase DHPS [Dehalococcoidia bacterium]
MIAIGECLQIISSRVRTAIEERDKGFLQDLAKRQVDKGANMLDLNIGPQKKTGAEVMEWLVNTIQEVTDVPLSLDTTNAEAIQAGLKVCKKKPIINSTNADPERMGVLFPLAARHDANIIALTLRATGLPATADTRVEILSEDLLPAIEQYGVPLENVYIDPLVLTVDGCQDHAPEVIKAVRVFKQITDPPLHTTCGLSNISNGAPREVRPILNRIYLVMLMGAGLDSAILDPFDDELMETIRILEGRDDSTAKGRIYLALYDAYAAEEEFDPSIVDMSDPKQSDILKTIRVLENKTIYAHSYLQL